MLLEGVLGRFAAPVVVERRPWSAAVGLGPSLCVFRYSCFKSTTRTLTVVFDHKFQKKWGKKSISLRSERIVRKIIWNSPKFDENRRDALEFDNEIKSAENRTKSQWRERTRSYLTEISIEKVKCVAKGIRIDRRIEKKSERTNDERQVVKDRTDWWISKVKS